MLRKWRLRRAHARFLEASRNLAEDSAYWSTVGPMRRWILESIMPVPILGLHQDAKGLLSALDWLENQCKKNALREKSLQDYHRMVYPKDVANAGAYRKHHIKMEDNNPAPPHRIPILMQQLDQWLAQEQETIDTGSQTDPRFVLDFAVRTYYRIGVIHPCVDANGRVARLAMNHLLRRYSLGYVIFPSLARASPLWEILRSTNGKDMTSLVAFAEKCMFVP
jgi:fido (protein-threonine AMPylation protein)